MRGKRQLGAISGEDLIEARHNLGLSREEMAKELGIAVRTLKTLERDHAEITRMVENFINRLLEIGELRFKLKEVKKELQWFRNLYQPEKKPLYIQVEEKAKKIEKYREQNSF